MEEHITVTFKIGGMHCTSCAMNIDFELEDLEGVKESKTHYAKQITVITFHPGKVKHEQITEAIEKLGYTAKQHDE